MKKKVVIIAHAMRLGGVETSLVGLLHTFDYSKYNVDLFLYLHDGEFLKHIPNEVNLLEEHKDYASLLLEFDQNSFKIKIAKILAKIYTLFFVIINQIKGQNFIYLLSLHKFAHLFLPQVNHKNYDLAISFLTPHFTAANKLYAKKKIAWIHTDYSKHTLDKSHELKMWNKFDHIAAIGNDSLLTFVNQFPSLKAKVQVIENILPKDFVLQRSQVFTINFESNCINLCSVGRFTYPKNFDNIPEIMRYLLNQKVCVKWYLIGYGGDEDLIKAKIKEFDVEEQVIILGKKSNPYPYMNACDIYIQPSRYEGKAVTVREAQMLGKPVVITNYPSANSQLKDGVDGVIFPMETNPFAEELKNFINDTQLQKKLINNCLNGDFSNQDEIQKIYDLI